MRPLTWEGSLKIWELEIPYLKEFLWGGNTLGLVPASLPHTLGYACTCTPPLPLSQEHLGLLQAQPVPPTRNPQRNHRCHSRGVASSDRKIHINIASAKSAINIASARLGVARILPSSWVLTIRTPPPQKFHPMRKVFCGDGAWFAVPYLGPVFLSEQLAKLSVSKKPCTEA